ncbi:GNAT domain - like 4 [Theobroma cacao]|nr:GNAT domain - like 4 [Theobroma cacao]
MMTSRQPETERRARRDMTTIRRFCCNDLLRFASVNLDHLTETFNMSFYMTYLARWPDYFHVAEGPGKRIMGYIMGKVEGQGESWHGHVTAVTVAPEYRRQQLAKKLMNLLEDISDKIDKAYFVDLFVRASNTPAIKMYEKFPVSSTLVFQSLVFVCMFVSGPYSLAMSLVVDVAQEDGIDQVEKICPMSYLQTEEIYSFP